MNEVALNGNGGALVHGGVQLSIFEEIANEAGRRTIVGDILKFSKGDYLAGQNSKEIKPGTSMVANMDQLFFGWVRWENQKLTDQVMAMISAGEKPKKRHELGDDDESKWEIDANGKPSDPWQNTYYLVLKATDDSGDLYTFAPSSKGGRGAILDLCKAYGKLERMRPAEYPIIALNVDSYTHTDYGRIKVPKLDIVGWSRKAEFEGAAPGVDDGPAIEAATAGDGHHYKTADSNGRAPRGAASGSPAAATKF